MTDKLFPIGTEVSVQNENAHKGTIVGHWTGDLMPEFSAPVGVQHYYIVRLDQGGWVGGTSCEEGRMYVREILAHVENVEAR